MLFFQKSNVVHHHNPVFWGINHICIQDNPLYKVPPLFFFIQLIVTVNKCSGISSETCQRRCVWLQSPAALSFKQRPIGIVSTHHSLPLDCNRINLGRAAGPMKSLNVLFSNCSYVIWLCQRKRCGHRSWDSVSGSGAGLWKVQSHNLRVPQVTRPRQLMFTPVTHIAARPLRAIWLLTKAAPNSREKTFFLSIDLFHMLCGARVDKEPPISSPSGPDAVRRRLVHQWQPPPLTPDSPQLGKQVDRRGGIFWSKTLKNRGI